MKKVLSICLVLVMMMCMSITASAEGAFVSSPSNNKAPTLVECENESADCKAEIIITSYTDRSTLTDTSREIFEKASETIRKTDDLSTLNSSLADVAKDNKVAVTDLAVSDLFFVSSTDCADHSEHGDFDVTLKADTLKNFVGLLIYDNGEWKLVKDAKVTNNGTHLEFSNTTLAPYAIVVNSSATNTNSPETEDNSLIPVCAVAMVVSGAALLFVMKKTAKHTA